MKVTSMLKRRGFCTITEFARVIGVSQPSVYQAVKSGRLTVYLDLAGRKWLKTSEAVRDWDNNRTRFDDNFFAPRIDDYGLVRMRP
jgi:excisionase family DNA binding protein